MCDFEANVSLQQRKYGIQVSVSVLLRIDKDMLRRKGSVLLSYRF